MKKLDQAQILDQCNHYIQNSSARNKHAAIRRAEWNAFHDNLGWHEKHLDPETLVRGRICCLQFIATNGGSMFGAERRTLKQGMTGDDVKQMQGIVGATQDGNFGPKTKGFVITWQKKNSLVPDGIFGPASWAKSDSGSITDADRERILGLVALTNAESYADSQGARDKEKATIQAKRDAANPNFNIPLTPSTAVAHPTIRLNSRGDAVREWQKILGLAQTGMFDQKTVDATKVFQRSNKLDTDGIVGPKTWMAAYSSYSASTNAPTPGIVIDSTGVLPPAPAPTTAQVLANPPATNAVVAKPIGQPIKPSVIKQVIQQSPKVAPPAKQVLAATATNGQTGTFVQQASVNLWNPFSWTGPQKVVGGIFTVLALAFGKKEYDRTH